MAGKQASQNFEIKESTVELGDSELFGQGKIVQYWQIHCSKNGSLSKY